MANAGSCAYCAYLSARCKVQIQKDFHPKRISFQKGFSPHPFANATVSIFLFLPNCGSYQNQSSYFGDAQTSLLGSKLRKLRRLRSSRLKGKPFKASLPASKASPSTAELSAAFLSFFVVQKRKNKTSSPGTPARASTCSEAHTQTSVIHPGETHALRLPASNGTERLYEPH